MNSNHEFKLLNNKLGEYVNKKSFNPKLFMLIFHIPKNASVAQSGGARDL